MDATPRVCNAFLLAQWKTTTTCVTGSASPICYYKHFVKLTNAVMECKHIRSSRNRTSKLSAHGLWSFKANEITSG